MMEKPLFVYGDELRFTHFIKNLDKSSKTAIISHTDLDGLSSARLVDEVVHADIVKFIDYDQPFGKLVDELRVAKVKAIICTDFMIDETFLRLLEQFADVLIIDHHPASKDLNSDITVFMNSQQHCAAYLCYYLFSSVGNIVHLDWLVACASLSDWAFQKNQEWMQNVYQKYGEVFDSGELGIRQGKFWDAQLTLSLALVYFSQDLYKVYPLLGAYFRGVQDMKIYARRVLTEVDSCVSRFKVEKISINDGYFWEFSPQFPIKSLVTNAISAAYQDKTIIIASRRGSYYYLSARRQDQKINVGVLLQQLTQGFSGALAGGHKSAAGGHISLRDVPEFKQRLQKL